VLNFRLTTVLIDVLKDKSEKVKRKAMAALGEFLFYGATQVDENLDVWDMPDECFNTLLKVLRNTAEDEIVRFYVCKTIENITAQARTVGSRFAQLNILLSLVGLYATAKLDLLKVSITSCFHHSVTLNEALLEPLLDKLGVKHLAQTFENLDTNPKITQILMGLVVTQLFRTPNSRLSKNLLEDEALIRSIMQLLDSSSAVIKGRVMLYSYFLIKQNLRSVVYLH
jgi:serine/threonine-protein kinase ULK4